METIILEAIRRARFINHVSIGASGPFYVIAEASSLGLLIFGEGNRLIYSQESSTVICNKQNFSGLATTSPAPRSGILNNN
jgi:hypothetical protein